MSEVGRSWYRILFCLHDWACWKRQRVYKAARDWYAKEAAEQYQNDKLEVIKNPVVAEFLGFSQNTDFTESDLEKSILSNLQKFLMELGKHLVFHNKLNHVIINQ